MDNEVFEGFAWFKSLKNQNTRDEFELIELDICLNFIDV